jgi:hypothetical protein
MVFSDMITVFAGLIAEHTDINLQGGAVGPA